MLALLSSGKNARKNCAFDTVFLYAVGLMKRDAVLHDFFGEGEDTVEALFLNLARDRPEDASCARLLLFVYQYDGVVVEAHMRAVGTDERLCRAHNKTLHNLFLLHGLARFGALHGGDNNFTQACVALTAAA